jgi:uncharacterized membrane protein
MVDFFGISDFIWLISLILLAWAALNLDEVQRWTKYKTVIGT